MPTATCPECDEDVNVDANAEPNDIVTCEDCGIDLEILSLDPLEFQVVEEEDWDEDDEDDY